jgi:hypothetical protein
LHLSGRFARDRSSGFGSNYLPPKSALRAAKGIDENVPTRNMVDMSTSNSVLSKLCCGKKVGANNEESPATVRKKVPPPDFFLGETPGTQIWARLRLAGLETERIFDLDTKNVMIKIRCPTDRIMDVAEVLMLRLKTVEGKSPISEYDYVVYCCVTFSTASIFRWICTIQGENARCFSKD